MKLPDLAADLLIYANAGLGRALRQTPNVVVSRAFLDGISIAQSRCRAAANVHNGGNDVQNEFLGTVLAEYQICTLGNRSSHHSGNAVAGGMRLK